MNTYHIHIEGQVQGVGFRPYVYRKAIEHGLMGWVSNGVDGVHIEIQGQENACRNFYHWIIDNPPLHSHILKTGITKIESNLYPSFSIRESSDSGNATLLLTPDIATCKECRQELKALDNRRYHYPFTTCTHCGPRYSIIQKLPYDRKYTSMTEFVMCGACKTEYGNVWDRRHYSQTNSCRECGVSLAFHDGKGNVVTNEPDQVIQLTSQALNKGKIVAMKGVGGYLLLCNARQREAIELLRNRKRRPRKPLALLYPSMVALKHDCHISEAEEQAILSPQAPIVIVRARKNPAIAMKQIAPGLNTLGVMLPYSPLMIMLMEEFQQPVIATSGNQSGSPIFYDDEEALKHLASIADYFVTHNIKLTIPQDDSVMRFTREGQRIILRRSRGIAPTFFPTGLDLETDTWLAVGCDLKSAFGILHNRNIYISQFLGDLSGYTTLQSYVHVLRHLRKILGAEPSRIIIDKHPGYFSSNFGRELADAETNLFEVQHHHAHFHSVLAENNLHTLPEPVLGVIWDGTGYGDDGNIWGGEFFSYQEGVITRIEHLSYSSHILGDKFPREPRIAALSLCEHEPEADTLLKEKFSNAEWELYKKMIVRPEGLKTSSVGRLFDAVAALLGVCDIASFEGEAAMNLEMLATSATVSTKTEDDWFATEPFSLDALISKIVAGIHENIPRPTLAFHFHLALVRWIDQVATRGRIQNLAFSGGVFQNALLVHLLKERLNKKYVLWFHQQLSPNDECICLGQLACAYYDAHPVAALVNQEENAIELSEP